jgi:hypothetical protein
MLIKNTNDRPVDIVMKTRPIRLNPGEEKFITADEVRDNALREKLQVRAVSIVRPSTQAEEDTLMQEIEEEALRAAAEAAEAEAAENAEEAGGS